ncbi:MAG: toprim domain-containing protein [Methanobacteriaceae archaeon]
MKGEESKEYNEFNEIKPSNRPMDVRIIVEGASDVESVSKAMKGISLGSDFHITISSIIPTVNVHVAKKAAAGADIVLVATDLDSAGKRLAKNYEEALEGLVGHVERVKFPNNHDVEYIDPSLIQEEIRNAIIRSGLSFVFKIGDFNSIKSSLATFDENIDTISNENDDLKAENYTLTNNVNSLQEENNSLKEKVNNLNHELDDVKSQYSDFKARYSNIYNKNLVEVFSIKDLWETIFNEHLDDEDKVIFATSKFKPDNIITGQGWICAASKADAVDWLKIIKTALIFADYKPNPPSSISPNIISNSNSNHSPNHASNPSSNSSSNLFNNSNPNINNNVNNIDDANYNMDNINNNTPNDNNILDINDNIVNNSPSHDYSNYDDNNNNYFDNPADNNPNAVNEYANTEYNDNINNAKYNYNYTGSNNPNNPNVNNNDYNSINSRNNGYNSYNNDNNDINNINNIDDNINDINDNNESLENAVSNFFNSELGDNKEKKQLNNFKNFWEQ